MNAVLKQEEKISKNTIRTFQKSSESSESSESSCSITTVESGLDFILSHFSGPEPDLFPRTVMTKSLGYQKEVYLKEHALEIFKQSEYQDCRINAFSYSLLEFSLNWTPNLIFIDLDLQDFKGLQQLKQALVRTLANIKKHLSNKKEEASPTVLWSGGGYHIVQPVECPVPLEQLKEFNEFDKPSEQFLRFLKDYLSSNKADKQNNPSFKSCLLRIPGSINSKYNTPVKIVQKWNGYKPRITKDLIIEFRGYLIQDKIKRDNKLRYNSANNSNNIPVNPAIYYQWIDQLLQVGIEDCRKDVLDLIIIPYLVHIKKYADTETTTTNAQKWLELCNNVRRLDDKRNFFHTRIPYAIKSTLKKQILPMSPTTIKSESRWKDLYKILRDKGVLT